MLHRRCAWHPPRHSRRCPHHQSNPRCCQAPNPRRHGRLCPTPTRGTGSLKNRGVMLFPVVMGLYHPHHPPLSGWLRRRLHLWCPVPGCPGIPLPVIHWASGVPVIRRIHARHSHLPPRNQQTSKLRVRGPVPWGQWASGELA